MRNIIVGSLVAITLAALAVVAAGVSTARAEDFEVEFMEFSIDKKFPINPSTGEFQVKGKVICQETPYDEPGFTRFFSVSGNLEQQAEGQLITGSFSTLLECGPKPKKWSAEVTVDNGRFYAGRVNIHAQGCASPTSSVFDCDEVSTRVRLKKSKD
jgi:hypothetical protein